MSAIPCTCSQNDETPSVTSCNACTNACANKGGVKYCNDTNVTNAVFGMSIAAFLVILIFYVLLLVIMIWWSVHTMKKCNGNPSWLNPTIIVLLVLWIAAFPISPLIFVALVIILIIFSNKCRSNKK